MAVEQEETMPDTKVVCALPIFTTPQQQLTFYADDPTTFQQIFTIFNPYDFTIRFQVLVQTSDSSRYTLETSHGLIRTQQKQMIIIQHNSITSSNIGVVDKLKILASSSKPGVSLKKKEITLTLLASRGQNVDSLSLPELSGYLPNQPASHSPRTHVPVPEPRHDPDNDIVKKIQGYIIAFMLGVIACWYWKS